jgi:chromatin remodeling complex protein RSC6
MPKNTSETKQKMKKVKSTTESVSEPVPEPVLEPVPEPVSEPVSAPEPVPEPIQVQEQETNTEILFNKLVVQFQDIQLAMKTLHSNLKVLQKEVLRERKELKKRDSKHKKKSDKKRNPSGFAKPSSITSELATFLGIDSSLQLARTDVTSKVIAYVKEHNLQNPENKRQIVPDEKLRDLLQAPTEEVITFFNLQTYLKKHFLVTPTPSSIVL